MKDEIKRDKILFNYDIINLKDIACEELLYHANPSAVALSILCDFEGRDKQMVVNTILKRIRELTKNDDREYKNYLKKVTVLSTNRDLEENVKKGAKMLAVDIKNIPFYQDGFKEGAKEATLKNAMIMIKDFQIAIDDVVKKLNIKKEELLEYIKLKKEEK